MPREFTYKVPVYVKARIDDQSQVQRDVGGTIQKALAEAGIQVEIGKVTIGRLPITCSL